MVKDETLVGENDIFKTNLEILISQINERIDSGENRIDYTEEEIKQLLGVNYTTENFYKRLKNRLLDTDIGISIKRIPNNNKFIFFRKTEGMKRESDLLKINFEQKLKSELDKYLSRNSEIKIGEDCLKRYLDIIDYSAENIYQRLKHILYGTNIGISIVRDLMIDDKVSNAFIFYSEEAKRNEEEQIKEERKLIKDHNIRIEEEYREFQKERKRVLDDEFKEEKRRIESEVDMVEPLKPIPLPPRINRKNNSDIGFYEKNATHNNNFKEDITPLEKESFNKEKEKSIITEKEEDYYVCEKCEYDKVKFNEKLCPNCGNELNWLQFRA